MDGGSKRLLDWEAIERVAIVRSLPGLGDLLCAVPAFRALRSAFPDAQITLIGLPWSKSFAQRFHHYLDDWLEFPGYPGIPEAPSYDNRLTTQAQMMQIDLALQMHGDGSVMSGFIPLLGAKTIAGFYPAEQVSPNLNYFLPYPRNEPEIWRLLRLMEFLEIPVRGDYLEFPLEASEQEECHAIASSYQLTNYVCIHPGASTVERRWSIQNFVSIADRLADRGLQVVLTGTASEANLTQAVATRMYHEAIDLTGKTSLGVLAALLKKSRLLICNDTGVSHLAAAVQTSSVVIFSNSEVQRWRPLDRHLHRVVLGRNQGSIETVSSEAFNLLGQEVAYAS